VISIRRARRDDVEFLVGLLRHDEVEPFLSARGPTTAAELETELDPDDPRERGRFVIEVDGERAGAMAFQRVNARSRIARAGGLAVLPAFRGRGVADEAARLLQRHLLLELGFHRIELEIYAFNERAQAHAERVGFVREGARRNAYRRHGAWVDGILYGLVLDDIDPDRAFLDEHVERFNEGVRSGDFSRMVERLAVDAELVFEGVPVGPFVGREAIEAAYREQPPDDEILVLGSRVEGAVVVAVYAWASEPTRAAGELHVTREGAEIVRLLVTFAGA